MHGWSSRYLDCHALERQIDIVRRVRQLNDTQLLGQEKARFLSILDGELEKINMFHSEAVAFFAGFIHLLDHQLKMIEQHKEADQLGSVQFQVLRCGKGLLNLEDYVLLVRFLHYPCFMAMCH